MKHHELTARLFRKSEGSVQNADSLARQHKVVFYDQLRRFGDTLPRIQLAPERSPPSADWLRSSDEKDVVLASLLIACGWTSEQATALTGVAEAEHAASTLLYRRIGQARNWRVGALRRAAAIANHIGPTAPAQDPGSVFRLMAAYVVAKRGAMHTIARVLDPSIRATRLEFPDQECMAALLPMLAELREFGIHTDIQLGYGVPRSAVPVNEVFKFRVLANHRSTDPCSFALFSRMESVPGDPFTERSDRTYALIGRLVIASFVLALYHHP